MTTQEYLNLIDEVNEKGKYKADWASLTHHKVPDWYMHDKLGVFIHWGIYSVPAFGSEWYSRSMYDKNVREFEHHRKTYGEHKDFGYKDFIPMFKAEKFDASKWVLLFKKAGIKYVMPVAEHHDGFAMYDTEFNRWNATKMGPCRDVVGELKAECENQGLTLCASTHRAEHYFFMNLGRTFDSDVNDDNYRDFYGPAVFCKEWDSHHLGETTENTHTIGASKEWLEDWLVRTCELIDKYQLLNNPFVTLSCADEFDWPTMEMEYNLVRSSCLGGKSQMGILLNGDIVVCCLDYLGHTFMGNIYEDKFIDVLNSEKYIAVLKGWNDLNPYFALCKKCTYRNRFRKEK